MNTENLMIFENPEFGSVRTFMKDGAPWFIGNDVAENLGYSKPYNAISAHVDAEDKTTTLIQGSGSNYKNKVVLINESGLYSLILSSKLPAAKQFKRWITNEVLPSIRKHGAYVTDAILDQLENNPDLVTDYLQRLRDENSRAKSLHQELTAVQGQLADAQPKADYYDTYVSNKDLLCFRYVAKELQVRQSDLIQYLLDRKLLYRDPHRDNRVFPAAGPYDHLFAVRDFYKPGGTCGQYTLLTPAARQYLQKRREKIAAYNPKNQIVGQEEICLLDTATVRSDCKEDKK